MAKIPNWSPVEGRENIWYNEKTNTYVGFKYSKRKEKWQIMTDNQLIGNEETREDARQETVDWMRDHPKPSMMY